jgi:threonylcarbamoyladenosine tRNA methylthiotransferase MtaB
MATIYLHCFGCKVNQFELDAIGSEFITHGCIQTSDPAEADCIIINTCAVTAKAEGAARRFIGHMVRQHTQALVAVTGCCVQLTMDQLRSWPEYESGRLLLFDNNEKAGLANVLLNTLQNGGKTIPGDNDQALFAAPRIDHHTHRTRALLRIQDGCDNYCSYCVVPHLRGPSISVPPTEIVTQARSYAAAGYREMVVTGINLGAYGADCTEKTDIAALMGELCALFPDIRFRLSSIEPRQLSTRLLKSMQQSANFMPHLHIPLQSGDNDILARMNRDYTAQWFGQMVADVRRELPHAAIGIDVLVGFPGESDAHFDNTRTLLQQIDCSYLHVFPYSQRPHTPAAGFTNQVPSSIKTKRAQVLRELSAHKRHLFYRRHHNSVRPVLIEKHRQGSMLHGYTDNYIAVELTGDDSLMNRVVPVKLEYTGAERMRAALAR